MGKFTEFQNEAIRADGNVLVSAGAGTGKTRTVVERCLRLMGEGVSLENILMVTFTEAAAAEMRARLRKALEEMRSAECGVRNTGGPRAGAATDSALRIPRSALEEQIALLDTAHISTLHGFCLQLVREHFHELGIDPQVTVLDETQTRPLVHAALDDVFARCYERRAPFAEAALALVRDYGGGSEEKIRGLMIRLHRYTQTLPRPQAWLAHESERLAAGEPPDWPALFVEAFDEWRYEWLEEVTACSEAPNVAASLAALTKCGKTPTFASAAEAVRIVVEQFHGEWPRGMKTRFLNPIKKFFEQAEFLSETAGGEAGRDALREDWNRMRGPMLALLELTRAFTTGFTRAKRALGGVDFADLEQLALACLLDESGTTTELARQWQARFSHVFVDECQDINAAQDAIITAVSRVTSAVVAAPFPPAQRKGRPGMEDRSQLTFSLLANDAPHREETPVSGSKPPPEAGNRFLVGDVKQSIYRFRLADPTIFRRCEETWREGSGGRRIPLADNFRSRESILHFINPLFAGLMRPEIGGVHYDEDARLRFGNSRERIVLSASADTTRRVELHVIYKPDATSNRAGEEPGDGGDGENDAEVVDLGVVEAEARLIAARLCELRRSGHEIWDEEEKRNRRVEWRDMVVLLRSPGPRVEAFAKEFARAGVPLSAARAGFFSALEVLDLINLLRLLDNPLQDIPLVAVLRSPLFGFSPDELAAIRIESGSGCEFFAALNRFHFKASREDASSSAVTAKEKVRRFHESFERWRSLARHTSLSQCLEAALAETDYEAQLLAGGRGRERAANVQRLLELARHYDPFQRQGLYRFLRFVDEQQDAGLDQDVAVAETGDAVRLMSIHRSKGLEFPVVVVGCLATQFNQQDLSQDILLSPSLGLCAKILCPESQRRYPSLPWWLARRREQRELLGEEMRLLYVAMTRARDTLLLTGFDGSKSGAAPWPTAVAEPLADRDLISARSYWDWLRLWLGTVTKAGDWKSESEGANSLLSWRRVSAGELSAAVAATSPTSTPGDEGTIQSLDLESLHARIAWQNPWPNAAKETAKTNVTALRRRTEDGDDETRVLFRARRAPAAGLSAADIGLAHHTFLQHVELDHTGSLVALRNEAERMVEKGQLDRAGADALDFNALLRFWLSPLGQSIAADAKKVHRELPFTARFTPGALRRLGIPADDGAPEDFIVVQGVIDLAVLRQEEIWLIDFKTDVFPRGDLEAKAHEYAPQVRLYASALSRIYARPVTGMWLHFLALGETVPISDQ